MLKGGLSDQLKNQPSMPELHQLLSQALEKRGQHLKHTWRGKGGVKFTLQVICHLKGGDPQWILNSDKTGREPLVDYTSCDILLVSKILVNAINKPTQQNSISFKKPEIKPVHKNKSSSKAKVKSKPKQDSRTNPESGFPSTNFKESKSEPKSKNKKSKDLVSTQELSEMKFDFSTSLTREEDKPKQVTPVPKYGDLSKTPIAEILQLIVNNKATGRVDLAKDKLSAEVFFESGVPVDANASDAVGDDAIIEILTWKHGHYRFEQQEFKSSQTVQQSIEKLKDESNKLTDHIEELKSIGMLPTSKLVLNTENPPSLDASSGPKLDAETVNQFYSLVDGKHSIEDLTRELSISRIKLLHLIHHLVVELKTLSIKNEEDIDEDSLLLIPKPIDTAAIQQVMMSLRRQDTGMFIYPAFLYFLEQEYFRSYRSRTSFTVSIFELKNLDNNSNQAFDLELESVVDAVVRISRLKRHVDILAHYDDSKFALLLPNTKAAGAKTFSGKLIKTLKSSPLNELKYGVLDIHIGTASVPEDFKHLSSLLGAADLAFEHARKTQQELVQFNDIKEQVTLP